MGLGTDADGYTRAFKSASEASLMRLLSERGLVPPVLRWESDRAVMESGTPLPCWLLADHGAGDRALMRSALLDLIRAAHGAGVCHRDLHSGNIVVIEERPLLVDLDLAVEVDSRWPCYDLAGPSERVPIPHGHVVQGGIIGANGVWWDAPKDPRWINPNVGPLGTIFGAARPDTRGRTGPC